MAGREVGVRSVAVHLPERVLTTDELARLNDVTPEDVARVMGEGRCVHVSDERAEALGLRAARRCLDQAGVTPDQVDAIIWCGASTKGCNLLPASEIQHELGAEDAFTIDFAHNCADVPVAMRLGRSMIFEDPNVDRVLIVAGEHWSENWPTRAMEPIRRTKVPNLVSDGGGAMLLEAGCAPAVLSFGFATRGEYRNFLRVRYEVEGGNVYQRHDMSAADAVSDQQVGLDLVRLFRLGLARCLDAASITTKQIDHLIGQLSAPPIELAFARALGVPPEKVVKAPVAPTHSGVLDTIFGLDRLLEGGRLEKGQHALMATRGVGMIRCVLLRG